MSTFKKTKVVMLSTNEKASLKLGQNGLLVNNTLGYDSHFTNQHLYILSDEEIKEGEHCYDEVENRLIVNQYKNQVSKKRKKIIATTDKSLRLYESETLASASGFSLKTDDILLPQPSTSFIEKFVEEYNKGNQITEVMVEYHEDIYFQDELQARGKLKINPKDNTITIKKIKDSWNREEVIELLQNCWSDSAFNLAKQTKKEEFITFDKWIEENL